MNPSHWLIGGMLAGLAAALWNLLALSAPLPAGVVARVEGHDILQRDWLRAIDGAEQSRRTPLSATERDAILQRLIDEQLLLSYGQDLDLIQLNPRLRKQMVDAVLQLLRTDADDVSVDDATLHTFFDQNRAYFSRPPQLRLAVYRHAERSVLEDHRAQLMLGRPGTLAPDPGVPDALLPLPRLRRLIGPALGDIAKALKQPGLSGLIALDDGHALLELRQIEPGHTPEFQDIRSRIAAEWRRREAEREFETLLAELRDRYDVQITDLPR